MNLLFVYSLGCLITTHTKWSHKLDFPSEDWPIVDFPAIRYPMDQHVAENRKEEERCIQQVWGFILYTE